MDAMAFGLAPEYAAVSPTRRDAITPGPISKSMTAGAWAGEVARAKCLPGKSVTEQGLRQRFTPSTQTSAASGVPTR